MAQNEIQRLYFGSQASPVAVGNLEAGSYQIIGFSADTSSAIAFNDGAAVVQSTLESLASIGAGNVAVTAEADGFTIELQGSLANTDLGDLSAGSNTLTQKADTVSTVTTTNGTADTWTGVTLGGSFTDGDDVSTAAIQTITFSPAPERGTWTFNGTGSIAIGDTPSSPAGWSTAGSAASGTVTVTRQDTASGQSSFSHSVDSLEYKSATGNPQIVTVTLPDSPTEGNLHVTLEATSADFSYADSSPAAITGWTGGGSAGNWTYTRDTNAADVAASGGEGSTPLRKACGLEFVTVQDGSASSGNRRRRLLLTRAA